MEESVPLGDTQMENQQLSQADLDLLEVMEDAMKPVPSFSLLEVDSAAIDGVTVESESQILSAPEQLSDVTTTVTRTDQHLVPDQLVPQDEAGSLLNTSQPIGSLSNNEQEVVDKCNVPVDDSTAAVAAADEEIVEVADESNDTAEEAVGATVVVAESAREVLRMFYAEHNPSKIDTIDLIMQRFEGKETEMLESLKEKYEITHHPVIDAYLLKVAASLSSSGITDSSSNSSNSVISSSPAAATPSAVRKASSPASTAATANATGVTPGSNSSMSGNSLSSTITGMYNNIPSQIFSFRSVLGGGSASGAVTTDGTAATAAPSSSSSTAHQSTVTPASTSAIGVAVAATTATSPTHNNSTATATAAAKSSLVVEGNNRRQKSPATSKEGATGIATDQSSLLMARIETLQSAMAMLEAENHDLSQQSKKQKREIQVLTAANGELERKCESLQQRVADRTKSETAAREEADSALKQRTEDAAAKQKLMNSLQLCTLQRDNKHKQLLEVIDLNHRLEAQVQYLAVKALENIELDKIFDMTEPAADLKAIAPITASTTATIAAATTTAAAAAAEERKEVMNVLGRFDEYIATTVPEVAELKQEMGLSLGFTDDSEWKSNGEVTPLESRAVEELVREIITLRKYYHIMRTSYMASRVELRQAVQHAAAAEQCALEQHAAIEELESKLAAAKDELQNASGSTDSMQQKISDATADISNLRALLTSAESSCNQIKKEREKLQQAVAELTEEVSKSTSAREQMSSLCRNQITTAEKRANEYVLQMRETVLLEREELLSQMVGIQELQDRVKVAIAAETQKELQRLRDELISARRIETQKDREVSFLQRQLTEAAKQIAQFTYEREQMEALQQQQQQQQQQQHRPVG